MIAPIALYPDALLSQVLVASTYPLEIAEAAQWLDQHRGLQGAQLADAARQQNWDPSIQALVAFPDVVNRLNADIRWTTDLGNAFLAQQADVMGAVQRMRSQAMAAGKLSSNQQQTVTTEMDGGQQAIDIAPANPEVVYVPTYNPAYVWGPPAWGYYPAWDNFGFGFGWGPGIYIGGFWGGLGWGGWGWGCNWRGGFLFTRPFFFSHFGYRGFVGGRAFGGYNVWAHNASHRLGVAYPNRSLSARYGSVSAASRAANYRSSSFAGRSSTAGGWNHFNGAGTSNSYRSSPSQGYRGGSAAQAGRSYGANSSRSYASPSNNRGYSSPSNNRGYSSPSYNRGYSSPSYNRGYSSPSYNRGNSAPSYRSSPSNGRSGGTYSAPRSSSGSSHSSSGGGGHVSGGGGGFHGGGGGGGSHGGGHR